MQRTPGPGPRGVMSFRKGEIEHGHHARHLPAEPLRPLIDFYWGVRWDLRGRAPGEAELGASLEFLETQRRLLRDPDKLTSFAGNQGDEVGVAPSDDPAERARENLILVLLNHHEFVTVR